MAKRKRFDFKKAEMLSRKNLQDCGVIPTPYFELNRIWSITTPREVLAGTAREKKENERSKGGETWKALK